MMTKAKNGKHYKGLKRLEAKLKDELTNIELEVQYKYSDVDLLGVQNNTLFLFEYKCNGQENKALHQLKKHQIYFVKQYLNKNPQLNINKVKCYYASPKGEKLRFEYEL